MRKILAMLQVCFLLFGGAAVNGYAFTANEPGHGVFDGENITLRGAPPGLRIYNCTGRAAAEVAGTERELVSRIGSMTLLAESELLGARGDVGRNTGRLPVTVEVVEIGGSVTHILSWTEGEDPALRLVDTNVRMLPDIESFDGPFVERLSSPRDTGRAGMPAAAAAAGSAAGWTGPKTATRCDGPCVITPKHNFSDGLGVRLPITQRGSVLSFSVLTSGSDCIPPTGSDNRIQAGGANFLYGGFESVVPGVGEITTDMGLIYQTMYRSDTYVWKPCYLVRCGKAQIAGPVNVEGQAFSSNGYIPGKIIDVELRIDPAPYDESMDRVLLRTAGYAYHETSSGDGGITYLVQLCYSDFSRIKTPDDWRLLATSVLPDDDGSGIAFTFVSGYFYDIMLDGETPVFGNVDCRYGYAENRGDGAYYLQVCRGYGGIKSNAA